MVKTAKNKINKSSVLPTSADQVPVRGEGGLRRSFLTVTFVPLFLVAILIGFVGSVIYSRTFQQEESVKLSSIGYSVLEFYDYTYPGDYNLLVDGTKQTTYLKKGDVIISEDTSLIDDIGERTGTVITIFFYDTRMMTTISDKNGKRIINTVANSKIVDNILVGKKEGFFNGLEIEGTRYCVKYIPFYSQTGTCIGMIGVGEPYTNVTSQVNRLNVLNIGIIIVVLLIIGLVIAKYADKIVGSLGDLRDFLGDIAQGRLDTDLDQDLLSREDEIGDIGRFTLYVRGSLRKLVEKDPLTNLNNRRAGQLKMDQIRAKAARNLSPYSVAMGDIDFFKKVNDTYGHDAGDAVLKEVARILSDNMMGHGTVIRWGGEEFLFIFDKETEEDAAKRLSAMLDIIRETVVTYDGQDIRFTMSYGVILGDVQRTATEDINMADERLYFAKTHGRNRVVSGAEFEREEE